MDLATAHALYDAFQNFDKDDRFAVAILKGAGLSSIAVRYYGNAKTTTKAAHFVLAQVSPSNLGLLDKTDE